jgi:hypothetical protein
MNVVFGNTILGQEDEHTGGIVKRFLETTFHFWCTHGGLAGQNIPVLSFFRDT